MAIKNNLKRYIIQERAKTESITGTKVNLGTIKENLANECGVSYHNIEQIYKGLSSPSLEVAFKICKHFNAKVDDIFFME